MILGIGMTTGMEASYTRLSGSCWRHRGVTLRRRASWLAHSGRGPTVRVGPPLLEHRDLHVRRSFVRTMDGCIRDALRAFG